MLLLSLYSLPIKRTTCDNSTKMGEAVKFSLRTILADSHVAAVAIASLLIWSLDAGFRALWEPLSHIAYFLFTAVAILGVPYFSFDAAERISLMMTFSYLLAAIMPCVAACILSRWVYGVGPLHSLSAYRSKLTRSDHA